MTMTQDTPMPARARKPLTDETRAKIADLKWFHSIDFGGLASSGRFKTGAPQNITLYGVFEYLMALDLTEASVLDIGTYDGIVSFGAHRLGAKESVAVDTFRNPVFEFARDLLGLTDEVEYQPGHQIGALQALFGDRRFDCIVCAGVIYHMLYPMQAFTELRKLMNEGGVLMMETPFEHNRSDAVLIFNGVDTVVNEPYTYFVPTRSALRGMANLAGFKVIGERVLKAPRRITLILQAVGREVLIGDETTPAMIVQMLKRDTCDDVFRYKMLEAQPAAPAKISFKTSAPAFEREIDANKEAVTFPYHPAVGTPVAGSTRFETERGNLLKL